jgi:hypothetical protein
MLPASDYSCLFTSIMASPAGRRIRDRVRMFRKTLRWAAVIYAERGYRLHDLRERNGFVTFGRRNQTWEEVLEERLWHARRFFKNRPRCSCWRCNGHRGRYEHIRSRGRAADSGCPTRRGVTVR